MPRTLTRGRARNTAPVQEPDDVDNDETEEEQEDAPRSRRAARSTGRRAPLHTEEEDEDEAPRGRRKRTDDADADERSARKAGSGWGTYAAQKKSGGDYAENFKMGDNGEEILIKFLDAEPFAVYDQHWLNELDGKKSFECLQPDEECPLCDDLGDKARTQVCFNVVDFTDPNRPSVKVWTVGPQVADTLKNYSTNDRTSPLDRETLYFAVSRSKKKNKRWETKVDPIKARDLPEDWSMDPLTADEIAEFKEQAYGPEIIKYPTRKRLLEIVDDLLGDE